MDQVPCSSQSNDLEARRASICTKIVVVTGVCEGIQKYLAEKQQSCCQLILKQTFVSTRFSEFYDVWERIQLSEYPADSVRCLIQANDQVSNVNAILTEFENKTQHVSAGIRAATDAFSLKMTALRDVSAKCLTAKSNEELYALRIPDFRSFLSFLSEEVTDLCVHWEQQNLDSRLDACFDVLNLLNIR